MSNSFWEWCSDYYRTNIVDAPLVKDPAGPALGNLIAARGGKEAMLAQRNPAPEKPGYGMADNMGIRLVQTQTKRVRNPFSDPFETTMIRIPGAKASNGHKTYEILDVADFQLSKYEVTQAQWKMVMGTIPAENTCDDCPVVNISYGEIESFLTVLNRQVRSKGIRYRLPAAAEWTCAYARAFSDVKNNKETLLPVRLLDKRGKIDPKLYKIANLAQEESGAIGSLKPVGSLLPDALGLYDLVGNVDEFCNCAMVGEAPEPCYSGGSYHDRPSRIAFGSNDVIRAPVMDQRNTGIGFRLVLERIK
jgi:formylglycine-generating enzyme required for sulfatase activity